MTSDDPFFDTFGPIDSLVVAFPGGAIDAEGFNQLLSLVNRGTIRILDLEFVAKGTDGSVARVDAHDLGVVGELDLAMFDGASSGLYAQEDFDEIGQEMAPGDVAAVLIYEELSLLPVIAAWETHGARVIGSGSISGDELVVALDATEG